MAGSGLKIEHAGQASPEVCALSIDSILTDYLNKLTIILKPHAHLHTIKKTQVQFKKDWYETVRGVGLKASTMS